MSVARSFVDLMVRAIKETCTLLSPVSGALEESVNTERKWRKATRYNVGVESESDAASGVARIRLITPSLLQAEPNSAATYDAAENTRRELEKLMQDPKFQAMMAKKKEQDAKRKASKVHRVKRKLRKVAHVDAGSEPVDAVAVHEQMMARLTTATATPNRNNKKNENDARSEAGVMRAGANTKSHKRSRPTTTAPHPPTRSGLRYAT